MITTIYASKSNNLDNSVVNNLDNSVGFHNSDLQSSYNTTQSSLCVTKLVIFLQSQVQ